ncbi:MAG: GSCFA domain-containing protein [Paludibacteraceae bacterium]|nr:GSCFA domain-containing protein [Paludibacteraceae bacterium]
MKLQTIVDIKPSDRKIGYEDKILMLGSCFSDEIGEQMQQRYLHVTCNPFGTLYNPLSIANAINYKSQITNYELPLVEYDGLWHSMAHHGSFSRPTKEEAEEAVRNSIETMQKALAEATVVIVTFGTAWIYEWNQESGVKNQDQYVVANCHKMPDSWFTRRRLSVEEIVAAWRPILEQYQDKHWIFTVSPIRHIRDGLHENQLSKATLLMAIERLTGEADPTAERSNSETILQAKPVYFEAFEILLDELRDYRFYADDLVHPSSMAVQYIWERFVDTFCTNQTKNELVLQHKRWKHEHHIPLH